MIIDVRLHLRAILQCSYPSISKKDFANLKKFKFS